jgi:hypothetical protein
MKNELDVRAALKRAAEPAEREVAPAIETLVPLGRRRRRVRVASMVLAALGLVAAVLGSLVLVNQAFRSPASAPAVGHDDTVDRGTYLLSDFEVTYPYQPRGADAPDDTLAGVRFAAAWSTDLFPGHADCRLILRDASGDVVGTLPFGLDLTRTPFSLAPHTVEVSAPPDSADGSCEHGVYPPGPGYTFTDMQVRPDPHEEGSSSISFTVQWATGVFPSLRLCETHVSAIDGREITHPVGMSLGQEGKRITLRAPIPPEQVKDAWITCSELRGPDPG